MVARPLIRGAVSTRSSRSRHRSFGFTLIEILAVLAIVAIVTAGALLSWGLIGSRDAPPESLDHLHALLLEARERAELENRPYGIRLVDGGYDVLAFDLRTFRWDRVTDRRFAGGTWPEAAIVTLMVDGRRVSLTRRRTDERVPAPDFGVDATGEFTAFELQLAPPNGELAWRLAPDDDGRVALEKRGGSR